jgi:hypothetical protein
MNTTSIFDCLEARLHTLSGAPTFREANEDQLRAHHERFKALNADKIVPRFGTEPDDEYDFFSSACNGMLEEEDRWRQCGLVWAWIDERPVWLSPVDWHHSILLDPKRAMNRRFRFTLLGGGQIVVIERFRRWTLTPTPEPEFYCHRPELRVTADAGEGLRHFIGAIAGTYCEMGAKAVLFTPRTPQSVADRVAATFRLLTDKHSIGTSVRGPDPENFVALLDCSEQCSICGRALRDHVSTLLGIGPDCARQLHLPHGLAAANKCQQRRRELLGTQENSQF